MKRISLVILALIMVVSMCACGKTPVQNVTEENTTVNVSETQESYPKTYENTETVTFPAEVVGSSDGSQDKIIKWVDEDLCGEYINAIKNEDGSVDFILTSEQRQDWLARLDRMIQEIEDEIAQGSYKWHAEHSEDYNSVSLYLDGFTSELTLEYKCLGIITWCRYGQIIKGGPYNGVEFSLINADTGKTIVSGNLRVNSDNIEHGEDDWVESYQVTNEEADAIRQRAAACKEVVIDPVAMNTDAITVIAMLIETGGNDFEYLFIDTNGNVVLGITDEQRNTMLSNMKEKIKTTKSEFKDLGNGYDVKIIGNYSKVHIHFNNELEEGKQGSYTAYFAMTCALIQALENEGTTPSVQVYIYNSDTGETVFIGNLADGITFKME